MFAVKMENNFSNNLDLAEYAVKKAISLGATDADVVLVEASDTSLKTRLGKFENLERSESCDLGIRVFISDKKGFKTSIISTNNLLKNNLDITIERAISLAKLAPADEFTRLAEKPELTNKVIDLQTFDGSGASTEELMNWALEAENSALEVTGVSNSEGADASFSLAETILVTSKGFSGSYKNSGYSISVSVIAGDENSMETDYEYSYSRFKSDLDSPYEIGKKAGELTVKKLNPRKIKTCKVPIIFDKRISKNLLSSICSGINGSAIVKKSSFLSEKLGEQILPKELSVIDDPLIARGLSSEPFDAEGISGQKMFLVKDGILENWILDIRSAQKLGLKSNGRASRGISSNPSPSSTNVYMEGGKLKTSDLIGSIKEGLYLTDVFGMGVNGVTGDYSQGANGFWIEKGTLTYPVSEITIAGNLSEMLLNIQAADDLELKYSKNAPTIRIDCMTIAGN
jgi:PmbA protein